MSYRVVFSSEAEEQLVALYRYVSAVSSPAVAAHYVEAILNYCDDLRVFPNRGMKRDDVRPGLRTVNYKNGLSSLSA
ncbi:hypothetical protein FACS1894216_11360 [Synergistales bacterium]|nr:hypothetical protein FACS1894216_11360 [Synergistales bacterium]